MARAGTDISDARRPARSKLMLDGQVVVISGRHLEVAGRIVFHESNRGRKDLVGREGQSEWEGIGKRAADIRATRSIGQASIVALRITERPTGTANGTQCIGGCNGDGIGHIAGLIEVEEARQTVLVEDAPAASDYR